MMLATQWPRKEAIMYLLSESTHRGNPLAAAHARQPQLAGARAKGQGGQEVLPPSTGEHTSFSVLGSLQRTVGKGQTAC